MSAVFPESMDKLDRTDVSSSIAKIENYIRYMTERIEFAVRNVARGVSGSGISSTEIALLLTTISDSISSINSRVNLMAGDITAIHNDINAFDKTAADLAESIVNINAELEDITDSIRELESRVDALDKTNE